MKKDYNKISLDLHKKFQGKLEVSSTVPLETVDDLSVAYTPGVAAPCLAIAEDVSLAHDLTIKGRTVAVVTDGSSVLGLGNIGAEAALPVMEGKAALIKQFSGMNAFPICLRTQEVDEIIEVVKQISPTFGAINLEDISAPRCFEIEERLIEELDIPVMHDDQHGTAIVILAALTNALKVVEKKIEEVSIVISGAGAAGIATANLLLDAGVKKMALVDSRGIISEGRERMNPYKTRLAVRINPEKKTGSIAAALNGADVFIGVSRAGIVSKEMVASMAEKAIVFAMANPDPEIMPDEAKAAGAMVVATGRSDFPNQVNNVLVFPGMFKGALEGGVKKFTKEMRLEVANVISQMVPEPTAENIIPSPLAPNVAEVVAKAVRSV